MAKKLKNEKRHQLIGTLTAYGGKRVKKLQAYYLQGGKWHRVKEVKQ